MNFWNEIVLPSIEGKDTYYICNQGDEKYKGIPLYSSYGIHDFQVEEYIKQRNRDVHKFSLTHKDVDICFKWACYIGMCLFFLVAYLFINIFIIQLIFMVALPCAYYLVLKYCCLYKISQSHYDFRIERFLNDLSLYILDYNKRRITEVKNRFFHHLSVKGNAVDIGLSVYWSDSNIGAYAECAGSLEYGYDIDDVPGCYFEWGETGPNQQVNLNNTTIQELKRIHIINDSNKLSVQYDAATVNWGYPWRMPTHDEVQELIELCKWEFDIQNGHEGYKIVGPNGASIFLPIKGVSCHGEIDMMSYGYYWIGQLNLRKETIIKNYRKCCANALFLQKDSFNNCTQHITYQFRDYGCFIRPVADKNTISPKNAMIESFNF